MAFICVELESIIEHPDLLAGLLERCTTITVSKDCFYSCWRCSAEKGLMNVRAVIPNKPTSITPTPTQSPVPMKLTEAYLQSDSVGNEANKNIIKELHPENEVAHEMDLMSPGLRLLQEVSANFSSYKEKPKTTTANADLHLKKNKKTKYIRKQCQLCRHWISANNKRAHVATHLPVRRLRCMVCGQGFNRMNRAFAHTDKRHPGNAKAKMQLAVNAKYWEEIETMTTKCFPRMDRSIPSEEVD